MTKKKERKARPPKGGSRIDYHIRATKTSLKRDNSSMMREAGGRKFDYQLCEYTHGTRAPLAGMYLYFLTKLLTLYMAKGVWWAFHRRKSEGDKP